VFPTHHLVPITLADQAAPDKGTEDALAHLGLHLGDGGGIKLSRCMKIHARHCISRVGNIGCIANICSRLKHPIHDAAVESR